MARIVSHVFVLTLLCLLGSAIAFPPLQEIRLPGNSWAEQEDFEVAKKGIQETLDAQVKAWNAGDIPGFMDGYVRGEELRFASGGTIRRGWQSALERYQTNYATREKMGTLTFLDLEFTQLSPKFVEVFGKYHLARDPEVGDATGLFTLLMKRDNDRWLVLHDHTSAGD